MANMNLTAIADFNRIEGRIRPEQHGTNSAPVLATRSLRTFDDEHREMHFYASRTHDWALWNAGQRIIDTHFIFPLMHLDPADPANYYFKPSDAIIKHCRDVGMKVFYRLGTSIEHNAADEHFNSCVPEDFEKYAEVLAGIVRHYVSDFADGCNYDDMIYWEIWNEPNLSVKAWTGDFMQFVDFFSTCVVRLKKEFPHLKIGGPALCGYAHFDIPLLIKACEEKGALPDFISWHYYGFEPDQLIGEPRKCRDLLDEHGWKNIETCVNEWHYVFGWQGIQSSSSWQGYRRAIDGPCGVNQIDSAAFNLAVLAAWQSEPLDTGFYYGANPESPAWGFRNERKLNKSFFSMKMFGEIMATCTKRVYSASGAYRADGSEWNYGGKTVYTLAALSDDEKTGMLLVSDYRGERESLELDVAGMEDAKSVSAILLDENKDYAPVSVIWNGRKLILPKETQGSCAFLVTFER